MSENQSSCKQSGVAGTEGSQNVETRKHMKLLFVCAANLNRSPTFENYFKKHYPQFEVKSAGTYYSYNTRLNEDVLQWADKIFVMDLSQSLFIKKFFPNHHSKVEVIGVSDQYDTDSPVLIELIKFWAEQYQW